MVITMQLNRSLDGLADRKIDVSEDISRSVRDILADIRQNGDDALRRYAREFDGFNEDSFLVTRNEIDDAVANVDDKFMQILERAHNQITEFHTNQIQESWSVYKDNGVQMGQIIRPLGRVALYVPGGTAAYPSSVLMNAIPAKLAGVDDIAIFTPVKADGKVPDIILAAAACCGVNTIYKVGGAHAIAAAAYGTESIPKVDKIVGPGNAYVATAKRMVYGDVDIDMVAGPSEILIIADESANPKYIAADLMSQAEHDVLSSAILVTTSELLINKVETELTRQIKGLNRKDIITESLARYGAAILVEDIDAAFALSNDLAPEHLEILTTNPLEMLPKVQNAGSIFLGEHTPEALGDYMSGTNHVLPTGGTAKFYSPLGVYDFVKWSAYSYYPRAALSTLKDDVITFANLEGLDAHANSIAVRFEDNID
ncbi:MAG: histidinol dehydrogenase [Oscillospiraceae bacterium]|nr:histidinol dehydrogenase [Oscillospiraceae bacterium]